MTEKTSIGSVGQHSTLRTAVGTIPLGLLLLLAIAVVGLTLAIPHAFRAWGDNGYMALALATGLAALSATFVADRAPAMLALLIVAGVAIVLRGILLFSEPMLSTDIYRYIWDARVQAAGINPYRYFPADEALRALRDGAIYPNINRADYAVTIYPPVAQMFFFAATRLGETVTLMKLAFLACEGVTVAIVIGLLRRTGRPVTRVVAYLWHPLPLWEIANSGHVDEVMIALMMTGLWLALTGRALVGAGSIALAALVKPVALLALPAIWRPWNWTMFIVVLALIVLCYLPYVTAGWGVLGFLSQGYLSEEQITSGEAVWPLAAWRWIAGTMQRDVIVYFVLGAIIVIALAFKTSFRSQGSIDTQLADTSLLLMVALFIVSPNYPWYFLTLTPFLAIQGSAPLWAMTLGALLLQEEAGWGEHIPIMIRKSVVYGAFIGACIYWYVPCPRKRLLVIHSSPHN